MNVEAEKRAAEIRMRAERKTGQLLTNGGMAKGGQPHQKSTCRPTRQVEKTLDERLTHVG